MNFAKFSTLTRLDQTIFSLPFLATASLCAAVDARWQWQWLWIPVAFLSARIAGMAFNQAIDSRIDAKNPRTASRLIASGNLSLKTGFAIAWAFLGLLLVAAFELKLFFLALLAATLIALYSYMKRIHFSCHFVLGAIHFLAPVMAWKVISGSIGLPSILLGCTAFFTISGSDILYAIADYDFDVKEGLHSLPAEVGPQMATMIAKLCHLFALLSMIAFGVVHQTGLLFFLAPGVALFFFKRKDLIFNTIVSGSFFSFTLLDMVWRVSL